MCLDAAKGPNVAEKDIECYKLIYKIEEGRYITICRGFPVKMGEIYHSEVVYDDWSETVGKALHSFASKEEALKRVEHSKRSLVVKCIIPRGSIFYNGKFNSWVGNLRSYASNTLTYIEILEKP